MLATERVQYRNSYRLRKPYDIDMVITTAPDLRQEVEKDEMRDVQLLDQWRAWLISLSRYSSGTDNLSAERYFFHLFLHVHKSLSCNNGIYVSYRSKEMYLLDKI